MYEGVAHEPDVVDLDWGCGCGNGQGKCWGRRWERVPDRTRREDGVRKKIRAVLGGDGHEEFGGGCFCHL